MAASLREFRRTDQAKLMRVQRATQQAFDRLPDAVAVLDLAGKVEVSTESAKTVFGLRPGTDIHSLAPELIKIYDEVAAEGRVAAPKTARPCSRSSSPGPSASIGRTASPSWIWKAGRPASSWSCET